MRNLPFWKLESVGNDFPLVSNRDLNQEEDLAELARSICDRKFGVGGDGLLMAGSIHQGRMELRMFNPDGTEDFCGNGIRCAALYAKQIQGAGDRFVIDHGGLDVDVDIRGDAILSTIGKASYAPELVPLAPGTAEIFRGAVYDDMEGSALTTGSTHVIVPVDRLPSDEEFLRLGPLIENHHLYPQRTSVIWREMVSPHTMKVRIWERGVGETLGCGTGSSAAVADLFRRENRSGTVKVVSFGGELEVSMKAWDAPIHVSGQAELIYSGSYRLPTAAGSSTSTPSTS